MAGRVLFSPSSISVIYSSLSPHVFAFDAVQDNLTLTRVGPEADQVITAEEAAKIIEAHLSKTLLLKDGQLAFPNLAFSSLGQLMPRLEAHGRLGKAQWRLVSAPSISGLFKDAEAQQDLLQQLTIGAEAEIEWGKVKLTAQKSGDVGRNWNWNAVYRMAPWLRFQVQDAQRGGLSFLVELNRGSNI